MNPELITEPRLLTTWIDPVTKAELRLWEISPFSLELSPFQRPESSLLKNRLAKSISIGFFCPIIIVRKDNQWFVVDGQHRVAGFKKSQGNFPMVAVEIPEEFMYYCMLFNIEMADKIKDICAKTYEVYANFYTYSPTIPERDIAKYIENMPSYITLAYAYVDYGLASPSLVETAVKKFDGWTDLPFSRAHFERQTRGELVARLENAVNTAAETYGIAGSGAHQLKKSIVSKTTMALWGRARNVEETFEDGISMMVQHIDTFDWGFLAKY